ncbi:hypothetical protein E2C01_011804 [Portunus trituberculatus]|uniref:Uncharacterized protein n=1 Tax=Portunus trituberculatus TaxID=210409 RepID=A0A5B7DCG7_PORTR|nr:hypothetical protein [Portunus trituberculatus]
MAALTFSVVEEGGTGIRWRKPSGVVSILYYFYHLTLLDGIGLIFLIFSLP